jgi:hypothetical protein
MEPRPRHRRPAGDESETIDRLFLLRYEDPMLYLPRSAAVAAALGPGDRAGAWYLIRADHPFAAFSHQRQLLAEVPGHAAAGTARHARCRPSPPVTSMRYSASAKSWEQT